MAGGSAASYSACSSSQSLRPNRDALKSASLEAIYLCLAVGCPAGRDARSDIGVTIKKEQERAMTTKANDWQFYLPMPLKRLLKNASWEAVEQGCSGTHVCRIGRRFLKIALYQSVPFQDQSILEAEMLRLQWLDGRIPVPAVHYYKHHGRYEFLLISEVPGIISCDEIFHANIPSVVRLLARGLRLVHSIDITGCPFDATINTQLELVRQRIAHAMIDTTTFTDEFQSMNIQEMYKLALRLCPRVTTQVPHATGKGVSAKTAAMAPSIERPCLRMVER